MLIFSFVILALFCAAAFTSLRLGVALTVAMAFLQDPLRKVTDGQPQIFILFTAMIFLCAAIGSASRGGAMTPFSIPAWRKYLTNPTIAFICILAFQSLNSFIRFNSVGVPVLGLISYILPLIALAATYEFAVREGIDGLRQLFGFYVVLAFLACLTIGLEALGVNSKLLGSVGPGVWITTGGGFDSLSGTFRASEIAAWHVAMASALAILLLTSDRTKRFSPLLAILIVCVLTAFGVLTGRRKFIIVIAIFAISYVLFQTLFVRRARVSGLLLVVSAVAGYSALLLSNGLESSASLPESSDYARYLARTSSVFGEVGERFGDMGLQPLLWAFDSYGFFGAGLGVGTQGSNAFLKDLTIGAAGEGGLGKLMLELGVPGLIVVTFMGIAAMNMIKAVLTSTSIVSPRVGTYATGLAAILVAQIANFSVATQAFGDAFILILDGVIFGALLACPILAHREWQEHVGGIGRARDATLLSAVRRVELG